MSLSTARKFGSTKLTRGAVMACWISIRFKTGERNGVVDPDPRPPGHYPTPEEVAQGLCRRDHVPLLIRHDEMRGVLLSFRGTLVGEARGRLERRRSRRVYVRGYIGPIALRKQRVQRRRSCFRVPTVAETRLVRPLRNLRVPVQVIDAVVTERRRVELTHYPQPE